MLLILQVLWLIAPAYAANSFAPLMRGKLAIDGGRTFRGKPLLGHGKTVEGTIGGIIFGIAIGGIQVMFQQHVPSQWDLGLAEMTLAMAVLLSVGAITGDIIASFFKRQIGMKSGASLPIVDQDDFVVFSLIFVSIAYAVPIQYALLLLVITPPIHLISNWLGYACRLKKNPW